MQSFVQSTRTVPHFSIWRKYLYLGLLFIIPLFSQAQIETKPLINATLTGTVFDAETKEVLPGAVVQLEGVTHSVQTDNNGKFSFVTGQKLPATIIISFIGYDKQKLVVTSSPVDVWLKPAVHQLSDVIVTGYSAQSRQLYTGSAAQVKAKALENRPAQSFDQLLGGQAAGVNIVQPSGTLNNTAVFRIRGINSITSSVYPLIIIDGVTVFTGSAGGTIGNNPLSDINPDDIETIDILKDASASAIYGSRAANGVVVITTKRGKLGSTKVDYNAWTSISSAYNLPELLNAAQYVTIKNEVRVNAGLPAGFVLGKNADGSDVQTN